MLSVCSRATFQIILGRTTTIVLQNVPDPFFEPKRQSCYAKQAMMKIESSLALSFVLNFHLPKFAVGV